LIDTPLSDLRRWRMRREGRKDDQLIEILIVGGFKLFLI
jgi:hypothetical protein